MSAFFKYLWALDELVPLLQFRLSHNFMLTNKFPLGRMSPCLQQCYHLLNKTGRCFGVMINVLDEELRNAVCIFYLILRAVDTIEDDMTIPIDTKMSILTSFNKLILDRTWKYTESKDEHAIVLENFPIISQALHELPRKYKNIIVKACSRFGKGMASFVGREIVSMKDFNEYSYYAAAIFCVGIIQLFIASGLENKTTVNSETDLIQFSLLLHKANYIKDFLNDFKSGRLYWPKNVWSKYVSRPEDLLKPENRHKSVECLNELITDAIEHLPRCLTFANNMKTTGTNRMSQINKVMAIASIERCYNNPEVFTKSVKIRRGEVAKIILYSSSQGKTMKLVRQYIMKILKRARQEDPKNFKIRETCLKILNIEEIQSLNSGGFRSRMMYFLCTSCAAATAATASLIYWLVVS